MHPRDDFWNWYGPVLMPFLLGFAAVGVVTVAVGVAKAIHWIIRFRDGSSS